MGRHGACKAAHSPVSPNEAASLGASWGAPGCLRGAADARVMADYFSFGQGSTGDKAKGRDCSYSQNKRSSVFFQGAWLWLQRAEEQRGPFICRGGEGLSGGRDGFSPRASPRCSPSSVPELRVVPRCLGTLRSTSEPDPKDRAGAGARPCQCPLPYRCRSALCTLHFPRHACIALFEAPGLHLPNTFWVQSRVLSWGEHFPSGVFQVSWLTEQPHSRSPAALCHPWPKPPCAPGAGAGAELRRQPQMLALGTAGAPARPEGPLACLHDPTRTGMAPRCCTEPTFERKASNLIPGTPSISFAFSPPRMQTAELRCCLRSVSEPVWLWTGAAVVPGVRWLLAPLIWGCLNRLLVLLTLSHLNSMHILLCLRFFSLRFATRASCFSHVSEASRGALIIAVLLEQRIGDPETAPHRGSAPAVPSSSPSSSHAHFCPVPSGLRAAAAGCGEGRGTALGPRLLSGS